MLKPRLPAMVAVDPRWGARVRWGSVAVSTLVLLAGTSDAHAVLRGQPAGGIARHVVRLSGPGLLCTATVVGPQEVLTARHCVSGYRSLSVIAGGKHIAVTGRSSGAPARLTLAHPLPSSHVPIAIGGGSGGFIIAGYGVSFESPRAPSAGLRQAQLVPQGGTALVDPHRSGSIGASACMGDSGGPVAQFDGTHYTLVGIIDRASHPSPHRACGHLTHYVSVIGGLGAPVTAETPPRRSAGVNKQKRKSRAVAAEVLDRRDYR